MKNIKDILWDKDCTGWKEYELRRWFYGSLNKINDLPSQNRDYKEEVVCKIENIQDSNSEDSWSIRGSIPKPMNLGWKDLYGKDLREYLKKGIKSFKIYDN